MYVSGQYLQGKSSPKVTDIFGMYLIRLDTLPLSGGTEPIYGGRWTCAKLHSIQSIALH